MNTPRRDDSENVLDQGYHKAHVEYQAEGGQLGFYRFIATPYSQLPYKFALMKKEVEMESHLAERMSGGFSREEALTKEAEGNLSSLYLPAEDLPTHEIVLALAKKKYGNKTPKWQPSDMPPKDQVNV